MILRAKQQTGIHKAVLIGATPSLLKFEITVNSADKVQNLLAIAI